MQIAVIGNTVVVAQVEEDLEARKAEVDQLTVSQLNEDVSYILLLP